MYGLPSIRLNLKTLRNAAFAFNGLLILLTFAVIFLCGRLGIHSSEDVTAYRTLIQGHYHPVWKDLAWRRIRKGDSVETILQKHPPLRREDFPPYVALRYHEISSSDRLVIQAKDGRLISAGAGHSTWTHFFFDSREEEEAFDKAYSAYAQQRLLESQALKIHLAIQGGQDVFLARLINSHGGEYREDEVLRELREIYGEDWLYAAGLGRRELTVEVTTVLHGGLQVGAVLTLPADNYWLPEAGEPEPVFLHVDDMRLLDPQNKARESYLIVPRKALDWYRSLTPDRVKGLEARGLARRSERWRPEEPLTRRPSETATKQPQGESWPRIRM